VTGEEVRTLVASRHPVDPREAQSIRAFVGELGRLDHPFSADADLVHITSSAIVVGPRGVLLHLHRRLGIWLQPGGHIDPGEEPPATALREVTEETGLQGEHAGPGGAPMFVHVDVHLGALGHTHLDLRWLISADGEPRPRAGESRQVRWFGWDEAIEIADPGLVGALRSLRPQPESAR